MKKENYIYESTLPIIGHFSMICGIIFGITFLLRDKNEPQTFIASLCVMMGIILEVIFGAFGEALKHLRTIAEKRNADNEKE